MFRDYTPDKEGIFLPSIRVEHHPLKGYICIAIVDIPPSTLIERCPTIKFAAGILRELFELNDGRTVFHDYNFNRPGDIRKGFSYFSMGYGGIYSHSKNANARWALSVIPNDVERSTLDIRATKHIKCGEEITIRYVNPDNEDILWFDVVEDTIKEV